MRFGEGGVQSERPLELFRRLVHAGGGREGVAEIHTVDSHPRLQAHGLFQVFDRLPGASASEFDRTEIVPGAGRARIDLQGPSKRALGERIVTQTQVGRAEIDRQVRAPRILRRGGLQEIERLRGAPLLQQRHPQVDARVLESGVDRERRPVVLLRVPVTSRSEVRVPEVVSDARASRRDAGRASIQ